MESNERETGRPKFQQNFHYNLLEREIGRDRFRNKPIRNSYHHSYQLLASLYPNHLEQIDLDKCEPPNADFPSMSSDADCLGFSPDGRFLAFHSHGHSAITVLKYYGVEETKNDVSHPMNCFDETTKVDLGTLTRNYHYKNEKAMRSWWTDDSSTLILQFTNEDCDDEEQQHDEPEEEVFVEINDITADVRGLQNLGDVPNPLAWDRSAGEYPFDPLEMNQREEEISAEEEDHLESHADVSQEYIHKSDVRTFYDQESSGLYEKDEFKYEEFPKDSHHRETSRTMPYYTAVEAAAQIVIDEERVRRETSRTMSVYHALISSGNSKCEERLVDENATSNLLRRIRDTNPFREEEPKQKRQKEECPSTFDSRNDSADEQQTMNHTHASRSVREVVHKLKTRPGYGRTLKTKGSNPSGLGYTRRKAVQTSCKKKKLSYSDRFRDIFDRLTGYDYADDIEKVEGVESTIIFFAFNVETDQMSILEFERVFGQFHYHAMDRLLAISIEDSIQIYHLSDEQKGFLAVKNFRFSQKDTESLHLKFLTGTMPGLPSERREVETGEVIGELYNPSSFHTPIQQDLPTLLHRDANELFIKNSILAETPTVRHIKCLSHDLLAISLSYSSNGSMQVGVIVSMVDFSTVVYPDYHEFLKLLFTHHLPDLLPRHWIVSNPFPVIDQMWFRNEIIDISKTNELADLSRLNSIYEFLHKSWHNPKTVSNPLQSSVFNKTHAYQLYLNYIFAKDGKISFKNMNVRSGIHMEQFFHPNDPFKVIKSNSCWYYATRERDPDDVIVEINK